MLKAHVCEIGVLSLAQLPGRVFTTEKIDNFNNF